MRCPECKNIGWSPNAYYKKPIKNLGDKEYFTSFITRRYCCIQCGFVFMTKEEFFRPINSDKNRQLTFLDESNGD